MMVKKDEVQKNVTVPRELVEWFDESYPMYGSFKWFVVTALQNFKEQHEVTPNELVKLGTEELLRDNS